MDIQWIIASRKKMNYTVRKKYPHAYPHYDDDNFYLPMVLGKGNVVYLIIDKYCIMDALKHWKFIKEDE